MRITVARLGYGEFFVLFILVCTLCGVLIRHITSFVKLVLSILILLRLPCRKLFYRMGVQYFMVQV